MTVDVVDLIIFLIVAFIAGTAAVALVARRGRQNSVVNTIVGMIGAFLGQFIFVDQLGLSLNNDFFNRTISIEQVTIAFLGAIILLVLASLLRR